LLDIIRYLGNIKTMQQDPLIPHSPKIYHKSKKSNNKSFTPLHVF